MLTWAVKILVLLWENLVLLWETVDVIIRGLFDIVAIEGLPLYGKAYPWSRHLCCTLAQILLSLLITMRIKQRAPLMRAHGHWDSDPWLIAALAIVNTVFMALSLSLFQSLFFVLSLFFVFMFESWVSNWGRCFSSGKSQFTARAEKEASRGWE